MIGPRDDSSSFFVGLDLSLAARALFSLGLSDDGPINSLESSLAESEIIVVEVTIPDKPVMFGIEVGVIDVEAMDVDPVDPGGDE